MIIIQQGLTIISKNAFLSSVLNAIPQQNFEFLSTVLQVHATVFTLSATIFLVFITIDRTSLEGIMIMNQLRTGGSLRKIFILNFSILAFLGIGYFLALNFANFFQNIHIEFISVILFIISLLSIAYALKKIFTIFSYGKWEYIENKVWHSKPLIKSVYNEKKHRKESELSAEYMDWRYGLTEAVKQGDVNLLQFMLSNVREKIEVFFVANDSAETQDELRNWASVLNVIYEISKDHKRNFAIKEIVNFISGVYRDAANNGVLITELSLLDNLLIEIGLYAITENADDIVGEVFAALQIKIELNIEKNTPDPGKIDVMYGGQLEDGGYKEEESKIWNELSYKTLHDVNKLISTAIILDRKKIISDEANFFAYMANFFNHSTIDDKLKAFAIRECVVYSIKNSKKIILLGYVDSLEEPMNVPIYFLLTNLIENKNPGVDSIFKTIQQWALDSSRNKALTEFTLNEFAAIGRTLSSNQSANKYTVSIIDMIVKMQKHFDVENYEDAKLYIELFNSLASIKKEAVNAKNEFIAQRTDNAMESFRLKRAATHTIDEGSANIPSV